MVKRPVLFLLVFFLVIFLGFSADFESLDWTLPFPDVILQDTFAKIDIGSGFYFNPSNLDSALGLYFQMKPALHFLIFDGTFNVELRTQKQGFDFFIDIANQNASDYFEDVRVKIKRLTVQYAKSAESYGEFLFQPYSSPFEKNWRVDWGLNNWGIQALSQNFRDWSLQLSTPEIGWETIGFGADLQGFIESTPTNSFAVSVGPRIRFLFMEIVPFVGYLNKAIVEGETEEPFSTLTWGGKAEVFYDPFFLRAGVQWVKAPEYFVAIGFGPVLFSFGERTNLDHLRYQRESWKQVEWLYQQEKFYSKIGFGNISRQEENTFYLFSDFAVRIDDHWALKASVKGLEEMSFSLGFEYSIPLGVE